MHTFAAVTPDRTRSSLSLPGQVGPDHGARIDLSATCSCGQELDARHVRCTRCGR